MQIINLSTELQVILDLQDENIVHFSLYGFKQNI